MKHSMLALLALTALGVAGCTSVKVTPSGTEVGAKPRPSDCPMDFVFSPPALPYDVLAELQSHVTMVPKGGAWLVLSGTACRLGADAVIVTRTQNLNLLDHVMVEGLAIKFRLQPPAPPPQPVVPAEPKPPQVPPEQLQD
jgi:hypothetical protein